jgi:hypothetical protein
LAFGSLALEPLSARESGGNTLGLRGVKKEPSTSDGHDIHRTPTLPSPTSNGEWGRDRDVQDSTTSEKGSPSSLPFTLPPITELTRHLPSWKPEEQQLPPFRQQSVSQDHKQKELLRVSLGRAARMMSF